MIHATILLAFAAPLLLWAQADVKGSSDHPLFPTRMPGYSINNYQQQAFTAFTFMTRPYTKLEGKYTKIAYYRASGVMNPGGLAIQRNYQNAIKAAGGQVVHADDNYVVMKAIQNGVEIWAQLNAGLNYKGNYYWLHILERTQMEQVISAGELGDAIDRDGFVALDVHFAVAKADILPESEVLVKEIGLLLQQRKGLNVIVEGHTDNTGTPAGNKTLSDARAKSVMASLAAQGIAPTRMTAVGYGQEQPVADNSTDAGRAKNRRVVIRRK